MRFLILGTAILLAAALNGQTPEPQSPEVRLHVPMLLVESAHGSYLGVRLADIDTDRAQALKLPEAAGVEVTQVEQGSPAEKAGIHSGDVLLTYNGENILGAEHLSRLVSETPVGRRIRIRYSRDGHEQTLVVTTGQRPDSGPEFPHALPLAPSPNFFNFRMPDMPQPLLLWKTSVGIECEPLDSQLAQYFGVSHGVLVRSVDKSSAGEKAGMRAGDVVTFFGDRTVSSPKDITAILRVREAGQPIPVTVMRHHRELRLKIMPSSNAEE